MRTSNPFKATKRARASLRLAILGIGAWLLCGCEQKELCYDHNHASNVRITFDWSEYPEANPSSMMTYLFPRESTERAQRREFIGKEGGYTQALVGVSYTALGYNSDTKNTVLRAKEVTNSIVASTKDAVTVDKIGISSSLLPRAGGTEEERMAMAADSLYSATSEKDILVTLEQNDKGEEYNLTLYPKRRFATYKVKILSVDNEQNISPSIAGSISGLSGGVDLSTGEKTEEKVTVAFPMEVTEEKTLEGQFRCFGKNQEDSVSRLVVYNVLKDGTKWCYVWDVTKQIEEAPDPYEVEIVLDKLPVPSKIGGNSGFTPDVSDWNIIQIPVKM